MVTDRNEKARQVPKYGNDEEHLMDVSQVTMRVKKWLIFFNVVMVVLLFRVEKRLCKQLFFVH